MFPNIAQGSTLVRTLSTDDIVGISNLYPAADYFITRGSVQGTVRTPAGSPVFGAHVVVTDGTGRPAAAALTELDGSFIVRGLEPGNYSGFAEPLDQPLTPAGILTLAQAVPNQTPNTAFATRFAVADSPATAVSLTKTAGDGQTGDRGQAFGQALEVTLRDGSGNPVAGSLVRFAATSGGGAVVPIQAATDAQGKARATAYLGKTPTQTFSAFAGSTSVIFTAGDRPVTIELQTFLSGLASPVFLTNARDGTNRRFVLEQAGRVRVVQPGSTSSAVSRKIQPQISRISPMNIDLRNSRNSRLRYSSHGRTT